MEDLSENETVMRVRVLPLYSLLGTAQVRTHAERAEREREMRERER